MENLAILVTLKDFAIAKSRLRDGGVDDVTDLARAIAREVLRAARPRPLFVACESRQVADFARRHGAQALTSHARDLNEAVTHAYQHLGSNFARVLIAHGDLRTPAGLGAHVPREGVTVFTDDQGTGTNVLSLPTNLDFTFHFGPDSAQAHQREAVRLGLDARMELMSPWRFDVDEPSDLTT